jgi:crotonobetainyl-CoA:carnitine CoA-transferase CaiB-like acyl-CoA transferase
MSSTKLLDGVRLVSMAQNVPGPLAVARLREAGARVTKIEPPGGDPMLTLSPAWHAEMHEGVTIERLDLKSDHARSRLTTLLEDADVFITSQRPSQLARLGCDPKTLRARVPSLRLLRIVGSLHDPEQAGHDLTYQAHAGILGTEMPRTLTADVMASERVYAGVLALLRQPPGSTLDIGLVESLEPLLASLRHGLTLPNGPLGGGAARYRVYAAKTGRVAIAALEPHFAVRLYQQLNVPLDSDLSACMRERTATEWESWARERDLPLAAVKE